MDDAITVHCREEDSAIFWVLDEDDDDISERRLVEAFSFKRELDQLDG